MFGNRKQEMADEIKELKKKVQAASEHYKDVADSRYRLEANLDEIRESRQQVEKEIAQVTENGAVEVAYIQNNINVEASLIYNLEHLIMDLNGQTAQVEEVKTEVGDCYRDLLGLLDSSKHYTSLSKSLQEFSEEVEAQNKSYLTYLDTMNDYGKSMGVLAINAAIEAGRLGAEGKQFVDAAEEIRVFAGNYKTIIEEMQLKIQESNEKLARMDEKISQLINLMKDNTITTGKIMKNAGETEKKIKAVSNDSIRTGMVSTRNDIIHIKELDDDLLKIVERNRIQISDMEAEFEVQLKNEDEFIAGLNPIFERAIQQTNNTDVED